VGHLVGNEPNEERQFVGETLCRGPGGGEDVNYLIYCYVI